MPTPEARNKRSRALVDGTKRLGWLSVVVLYGLNEVGIEAPDDEAYALVIAVAEGAVDPPNVPAGRPQSQPAPAQNPYPIPIAREADGTVTPYLGNQQLHAILDDEDLAQYQRVREP